MPLLLPPCSVLLVEDNALDVVLVETALEELQFLGQLEVVLGGEEAVKRLQMRPLPEVVLMDIHMPRVGGLGVMEALGVGLTKVKVVLWSSAFSPLDAVEAQAAGVHLYLEKPRTYQDLLEALGRVITC
ncbi:response regulator [Deinococcus hopiensis]|uniref:CheY chemotaxis protein or a CheY-like REC (Receiver) domain n=1 Tax=Deinococcus hopiensis KR-140 TaxID=695939 RepID=A0A1W1UW79_9DEIO|nr:response regulator [Deinococcus hopiensis]SMB85300.1 CheY chemotaxis protein or a CheY-like REC (receiver) domain [Deinococcus hopiensis KR-140]